MNHPQIDSLSNVVSAAVHAAVAVTVADTGLTGSLDLSAAATAKITGEIMFVAICTASTAPTSLTLKLQDSADNSTFADVRGTNGIVSSAFGASPNNTAVTIGCGVAECRRYVRLASRAITGTSFTISAYAVGGRSGTLPVA